MVKSTLDQLYQIFGSDTYKDDLDVKFAETCGESYGSDTFTTVSGSNTVTSSSSLPKSDVGNYVVLNDTAYQITDINGTTVTLDNSVDSSGTVTGDLRFNKNLQSDLNYIRSQLQNMMGSTNWNDEVCTTLCDMANLIPKEPNYVGDNSQYPSIRPGTVSFDLSNQHSGNLSSGAPAAEYTDNVSSASPGDALTFTDDTTIVISINGGFYPADKGTLEIVKDGAVVGTLDLAAAWTNDGCTYEESESDVGSNPNHTSSHTGTDIIDLSNRRCMNDSVDGYGYFWPSYQIASMTATLTLPVGYNGLITVRHSDGHDQEYSLTEFFVDTTSQTINATAPTVAINTAQNKYLSGVPYYNTNTTFDLSITNNDALFDRGYPNNPVVIHLGNFNAPDQTPTYANLGLSTPTAITDTIGTYSQTPGITVGGGNFRNYDATCTVTYYDVFGSQTSPASASGPYRIDTYGTTSTDTARYFDDEAYRFRGNEDFTDTSINTNDSNWDTTVSVLTQTDPNGNMGLVVYNGTLKYPTIDHSTYSPAGPDYSGQTGTAVDYELFIASAAFTHGTITFNGWSDAKSVIQGSNVEVHLRYPNCNDYGNGNTNVWQDLSVDQTIYGGNGCLGAGSSGSDVAFSFGTTSSVSYGNRVIMRIRFNSSSVTPLTGITFNPTL